jgi:hypothetical protein
MQSCLLLLLLLVLLHLASRPALLRFCLQLLTKAICPFIYTNKDVSCTVW